MDLLDPRMQRRTFLKALAAAPAAARGKLKDLLKPAPDLPPEVAAIVNPALRVLERGRRSLMPEALATRSPEWFMRGYMGETRGATFVPNMTAPERGRYLEALVHEGGDSLESAWEAAFNHGLESLSSGAEALDSSDLVSRAADYATSLFHSHPKLKRLQSLFETDPIISWHYASPAVPALISPRLHNKYYDRLLWEQAREVQLPGKPLGDTIKAMRQRGLWLEPDELGNPVIPKTFVDSEAGPIEKRVSRGRFAPNDARVLPTFQDKMSRLQQWLNSRPPEARRQVERPPELSVESLEDRSLSGRLAKIAESRLEPEAKGLVGLRGGLLGLLGGYAAGALLNHYSQKDAQ